MNEIILMKRLSFYERTGKTLQETKVVLKKIKQLTTIQNLLTFYRQIQYLLLPSKYNIIGQS